MKATLAIVFALLAALAVTVEPAAAAPVTIDLTVVTGGGELEGGSTLGMQFVSLELTNPSRTVNVERGNLVVDGARVACTAISSIVNCNEATLTCSDGDHTVVAGGPGVGSLDGVLLTEGIIRLFCFNR